MSDEFDNCFDCGAPTVYRVDENGDGGLVCTKCNWQAVEVVWFATGREPERG